MSGSVLVYAHRDGVTYVLVDDDGAHWRWPAVAGGWAARERCTAEVLGDCDEYPPDLARLALRLSGAPDAA